jgi:hypothetical protein
MKAIAYSYWRSIKRGVRLYAEIPVSVKEDVKTLAQLDVSNGVISQEEYARYIGEEYPEE